MPTPNHEHEHDFLACTNRFIAVVLKDGIGEFPRIFLADPASWLGCAVTIIGEIVSRFTKQPLMEYSPEKDAALSELAKALEIKFPPRSMSAESPEGFKLPDVVLNELSLAMLQMMDVLVANATNDLLDKMDAQA